MKRVLVLASALVLVPALTASAEELEDLLQQNREASYRAEQVISCATPDGVRHAVLNIAQDKGELRVGSAGNEEVEVAAGFGDWALVVGDGVVSSVSVESTVSKGTPVYAVEDEEATQFLGREATSYTLVRDNVPRADLVFDEEVGAMVEVVTFLADGTVYCRRSFVSLDPETPVFQKGDVAAGEVIALSEEVEADLPHNLAGFQRLDVYREEDGLTFAYYSDGFFSLAVFQTRSPVELADAVVVEADPGRYQRLYGAGVVTYSWETRNGGMALIGDAPPDLIEAVLLDLPQPEETGLLQRLWRRIFG